MDIVAQAYAAFAKQDLGALLDLVDPDVVVTQDDALPWGGRHVGRDGVVNFAATLVGTIDSTVTPVALFQAGEHVVQYGRTHGTVRASGEPFDTPECHIWTVRHGRIVEAAFFVDTDSMLRALTTR
jgi:ketosteroid isomerase-like protein